MVDRPAQAMWNQRHASSTGPILPCWLLQAHADLLPLTGKALDVACGRGGNALFLARCGLTTQAWDFSDQALTQLALGAGSLPLSTRLCDVTDPQLWPQNAFDVITVSRFLDRRLWPLYAQALKPGGVLFLQTFLLPVQPDGPGNPDYYLAPGEAVAALLKQGLHPLVHGEGWLHEGQQHSRQSWVVARK